jgi:hypothetical protein
MYPGFLKEMSSATLGTVQAKVDITCTKSLTSVLFLSRSQYGFFVNEGGLPVIGWNAGMRGFDYRNNEEYQNLPL